GEECDDGNMTPGDGCDASCVIEPFSPKDFSDSFDRATLGSNWMADFGSFAIIGNELVDTAMSFFTNSVLRWGNGTTTDIDQYGKLQLVNPVGKGWGFSFRLNGTPGLHYQVHLVLAENEWRWETYDPGYVSRSDSCLGDETASNGDWMGATVEGSGASTLVRVWRWNLDPDMGGPVDISNNWGAPDCIMAANPTDAVDGGNSLGLRTYNRNSTADSFVDNWAGGDCAGACGATIAGDPRVLEIFNGTGAGISGSFIDPDGLAFDSAGNVFAAACGLGPDSEGVFMRTPEGVITEVISDLGDNMGNPLSCPVGMLMSPSDTLSTVGFLSDNAFSRTSAGVINEIIDSTGDGMGNVLDGTLGIAIDSNGSIYVTGHYSDNVFRVETGGTVTEIIDSTGDGLGNVLDAPFGVAVDSADNVYVTGFGSDNIFQIAPGGVITEILDSTGGGVASLLAPHALAVGPDDSLYIAGNSSDNVLRRFPNGTVRVILDSSGAGPGQPLDNPTGIDVASNGKVYVAAFNSENVFEITPGGGVTELIDSNGDGITQFNEASDFCVLVNSATSTLYVANTGPETVYRVLLTCGDGVVEPGLETCDDAGASATCDDDCTLPLCGDGNVNAAFGEQCEVDVDCGGGMTCSGCTCS
ncbi:MAG: hypothetical protein OEV00_15430, partial [Acidobacteriota bacterium]|nr:hypothetical protein [Acidobacteriota bacterium]